MHLNVVPARTGIAWARSGVRAFWQQPFAMTGLFFLFLATLSLAALVPVLGTALTLVLLPAATLGMMAATREVAAGRRPRPAMLFAAFRAGPSYARNMLLLGLLYAVGFLLMLGFSALFDGGQFARAYLVGSSSAREVFDQPDVQIAMWAALAFYVPLSMLFWHAPALVYWYRVSPTKSLFFSLVGCSRNMGAFFLYSLAWFGIFVAGGLVVGTVTTLLLLLLTGVLGAGSTVAAGVAAGLMTIGALVLAAMFFTSLYFTFMDCFVHPAPPLPGDSHASAAAAPTAPVPGPADEVGRADSGTP